MLIVADDTDRTERELAAGEFTCPDCRGQLRPWGHARARWLRTREGRRHLRLRRSRCADCHRTHVLVPGVMLLPRRADAVKVIGEALAASAAGQGYRPIAARLGRPVTTVAWLGPQVHRPFPDDPAARHAVPDAAASPVAAALGVLSAAAAAVERRLGVTARSRWQLVTAPCSERLLANTSCPYPPLE